MNTQNSPSGFISAGAAKLAFDWVEDEIFALYALANAAREELEPPEGSNPIECDNFFAYRLVRLMHERLESTEFLQNLLQLLVVQPAGSQSVPAGHDLANGRSVQ